MLRLRIYWSLYVALAFISVFALSAARAQGVSDEDETTLHFPEEDYLDAPSSDFVAPLSPVVAAPTRPVVFQKVALTTAPAARNDCGSSETAAMVCDINRFRVGLGMSPLRADPALTRSAQSWSASMARRTLGLNIYHDNDFQRGTNAISENIGFGYPTARSMVAEWIKSPGHRADMTIRSLRRVGVGLAVDRYNRKYWTADFSN